MPVPGGGPWIGICQRRRPADEQRSSVDRLDLPGHRLDLAVGPIPGRPVEERRQPECARLLRSAAAARICCRATAISRLVPRSVSARWPGRSARPPAQGSARCRPAAAAAVPAWRPSLAVGRTTRGPVHRSGSGATVGTEVAAGRSCAPGSTRCSLAGRAHCGSLGANCLGGGIDDLGFGGYRIGSGVVAWTARATPGRRRAQHRQHQQPRRGHR